MEIRSFIKQIGRKALWSDDVRLQAVELLRGDPLYGRIPQEDVFSIAEDAVGMGYSRCDAVTERLGTNDPMMLAKYLEVKVIFDISSGTASSAQLSCYRHKPPSIVLYDSALKGCRERLLKSKSLDPKSVSAGLTNVSVAYELYHHLERKYMSFVNLGYRLPVLDLGFIRIEKSLVALSEIAAHAFAQRLLELPLLPCVLSGALFAKN